MSVSDAGGLFDSSAHVVVGVAQLVGQELDQVRGFVDRVVDDRVPGRGSEALLGSHRDGVKLVHILISDASINHSSGEGVPELAHVSAEQPRIHPLVHIDIEVESEGC